MRDVPTYPDAAPFAGAVVAALLALYVAAHVAVRLVAARRDRRQAAQREQDHADALVWNEIVTRAHERGHAQGRVSGRRVGYDAGHADGVLERKFRVAVEAKHTLGARRPVVAFDPTNRVAQYLDDPPRGFNADEGEE